MNYAHILIKTFYKFREILYSKMLTNILICGNKHIFCLWIFTNCVHVHCDPQILHQTIILCICTYVLVNPSFTYCSDFESLGSMSLFVSLFFRLIFLLNSNINNGHVVIIDKAGNNRIQSEPFMFLRRRVC